MKKLKQKDFGEFENEETYYIWYTAGIQLGIENLNNYPEDGDSFNIQLYSNYIDIILPKLNNYVKTFGTEFESFLKDDELVVTKISNWI